MAAAVVAGGPGNSGASRVSGITKLCGGTGTTRVKLASKGKQKNGSKDETEAVLLHDKV